MTRPSERELERGVDALAMAADIEQPGGADAEAFIISRWE